MGHSLGVECPLGMVDPWIDIQFQVERLVLQTTIDVRTSLLVLVSYPFLSFECSLSVDCIHSFPDRSVKPVESDTWCSVLN